MKTDLGSRIVRAWSIVPADVSERDVAVDLLEAGLAPRDLLADKGFSGRAFAAPLAAAGTAILVPPGKKQRGVMPSGLRKAITEWRNRVHLVRNTFRLTSKQDWDAMKRDVKLIYSAVSADAARAALGERAEKWGKKYGAVTRLWENAWEQFIP